MPLMPPSSGVTDGLERRTPASFLYGYERKRAVARCRRLLPPCMSGRVMDHRAFPPTLQEWTHDDPLQGEAAAAGHAEGRDLDVPRPAQSGEREAADARDGERRGDA